MSTGPSKGSAAYTTETFLSDHYFSGTLTRTSLKLEEVNKRGIVSF
jgi:hypothetical protein